jgi:hypothetical protein
LVYAIALVMGYFIGNNGLVEKRARSFIGMGFANQTAATLSKLGGLGGWFCILPAAYFAGSADGSGFMQGLFFVLSSLAGAAIAAVAQIPGINYLLSVATLFANIALAILVYVVTRA